MANRTAILSSHGSDIQTYEQEYDHLFLLPFYVNIAGESISTSEIEEDMVFESIDNYQGQDFPKTAIASAGEYKSKIEDIVSLGYDTFLYIHTAPELSGIANAVRLALKDIDGINYYMVNSQSIGVGLAAYIFSALDLINKGYSIENTIASISQIHDMYALRLVPKTLKYLVRGGRVSRPRYWLANLLNIKPILSVINGVAEPISRARGIENARQKVKHDVISPFDHDEHFRFLITHCRSPNVAEEIFDDIQQTHPNSQGTIGKISPGMAAHYGPGCISMIAWKYKGIDE